MITEVILFYVQGNKTLKSLLTDFIFGKVKGWMVLNC